MRYIKIITLTLLLFPHILFATWNVSADGRSASTPNPYSNNQNNTQTLTIANEDSLTVTIQGTTERNYDFVTITDSAGNTFNSPYHGTINETFDAEGPNITIRYTTDVSVVRAGVTVSIVPTPSMGTFKQKYTTSIVGNLKVIGNTVLQSPNPNSANSNAQLQLSYVNIDSGNNRFNSSSASVQETEAGVNISNARVKWAGLYWQSYLHNDRNDPGIDNNFNFSITATTANTEIPNFINNHAILFKVGSNGYTSISPDEIGMNRYYNFTNYVAYAYSAFADVTSLMQGQAPNNTYTVANIPTRTGRTSGGNRNDGLGNFGAWSLVIVYENDNPSEKTRNITIFDGYSVLSIANNPSQTINLSGFRTPRDAPDGVDSTLSIFAAEGDRNILGDFARFTNQAGNTYNLPDSSGAGSYFASVIEGVPMRNPTIINNNGIDIHTTQIGTKGGNESGRIGINESSASITLGTTQDTFMPSMIAFATELYMPKFCYDYNIQKEGFSQNVDEARNFTYQGGGTIKAHVSIRSMEGDFDLENTKLKFWLDPSDNFNFVEAKYSANNVNRLIPATEGTQHTHLKPEIAIGANVSPQGGTIGIYERYFAQFNYDILQTESTDAHFTMELNTSIDFGSGPVEFLLSSENNTFPRCEQNLTYNPLLGAFNIERTDSSNYDTINEKEYRFPLYTQVANKPFDISIVSYDVNASPTYMKELTLPANYVVDVELIDSAPYNDKNSFFKCQNTQESIIQTLPNGEKSHLVQLDQATSRKDISNIFATPNALWNAAFRLWYFEDNGSVIAHDCISKTDGNCWKEKVYERVKGSSSTDYCASDCSGGTTNSCYQCLRKFYATPVCSRDNFAVKPASYRIKIFDTNESNASNSVQNEIVKNDGNMQSRTFSAEYQYKVAAESTQFGNDSKTMGYTTKFTTPSNSIKQSTVLFNTNTGTCADTNDTDWGLWFENGEVIESISGTQINLQSNALASIPNVGNYTYHMEDNNWTIVDQARYVDKDGNSLKTFPDVDDCITSGADKYSLSPDRVSQSGCGITSNISYQDNTYQDIPLQVEPYTFDLSQVNSIRRPDKNILFMNDLSADYYGSILSGRLSMATSFEGNVSAFGKQNTLLSNFTDGCAASDVTLDLSRTMNPEESTLSHVPLQQYLEVGINVIESQEGIGKTLTLPAAAFENRYIGNAPMQLHTTLKKPYNFGNSVNPVQVNYAALKASGLLATSNTHMQPAYVPEGNNTYDQNVTYVYGKVTPQKRLYDNIEESFMKTPLAVDIFCDDDMPPLSANECRDRYGLTTNSLGEEEREEGWKHAIIFTNGELGLTDITVSHLDEENADPFVSVNGGTKSKTITDVPFDDSIATQDDINVSVAGSARNSMVKVKYEPAPWLIYDKNEDFYRVHFIGPSAWAGVGKTGHVTDTGSSKTKNNRMSW